MTALRAPVLALLLLGAFGTPAGAIEYTCPSDPGFCYLDIAGDGCFDVGTDIGPINDDLEAGAYPPVGPPSAGSIVCPPKVRTLNVTGALDWSTATGGDIVMHKARILTEVEVPAPSIQSGRDLVLGGLLKAAGGLLSAQDEVRIVSRVALKSTTGATPMLSVVAADGEILIGPKAVITGGEIAVETTNGGNVEIESARIKSKEGPLRVTTSGAVFFDKAKIQTVGLEVDALHIFASDVLTAKMREGGLIDFSATGRIELSSIKVVTTGSVVMIAEDVYIRGWHQATDRLKSSQLIVGGSLDLTATDDDVRLRRVRVRAGAVRLQAADDIGVGSPPSSYSPYPKATVAYPLDIIAPAGACGVSQAKIVGAILSTDCLIVS